MGMTAAQRAFLMKKKKGFTWMLDRLVPEVGMLRLGVLESWIP
jgi:hypothetical protein